jgi:hypothetical protein
VVTVAGSTASEGVESDGSRQLERRSRIVACAILALVIVGFVAVSWQVLDSPFGDSHDGRNGAVWASGSRGLRETGPLASRLGGIAFDGERYANHPPMILLETAAAETLLGEHPWSSRLPAVLSTIGAAVLVFVTCKKLAIRAIPAAIGTGLAFTTPMALVYGSMLDTPVTSLVFGAAVVLLLAMVGSQRASVRAPVVVLLTALACLAGWEAALLCWVSAAVLAASGGTRRRTAGWFALGALAGTVAALAWGIWVYDGPADLIDALRFRTSGTDEVTFVGSLLRQLDDAVNQFGLLLVGLGVAIWSCFRGPDPMRLVSRVLVATTLLYPLVFFNGAYIHAYWNFWLILPIALGLATLSMRLWDLSARSTVSRNARLATAAVLAIVLGVSLLPRTLGYRTEVLDAAAPAALTDATTPPGGVTVDLGNLSGAESWVEYHTRSEHLQVLSADDARRLAAEHPDAVLVSPSTRCALDQQLCTALKALLAETPHDNGWIVAPLTELTKRLGP